MILSILIPSIPDRRNKLLLLVNELYRQSLVLYNTHPTLGSVEILVDDSVKFLDGGLSIGGKRDLLKQRAGGKYLCFLDDDDWPTPNYIETLVRLCGDDKDIVTFRTLIKNDHYWALIDMQLATVVNDEVNPHGSKNRTPWHICPVKSEIAKREAFTNLNHNEDWDWMSRVLKNVHSEIHSDMILTQYNHSEAGSEADAILKEFTLPVHRTVLISLAVDGRERYTEKLIGLENSLHNWPYDTRIYKAYPDYCTPNSVIPYKFKFDLIQQARRDGYNRIVWLDSSIRLLRNPVELFGEDGVFAFDNLGHPLKNYISDKACRNLQITEGQLKTIPQTWGGAIGFDFTKDKACEIFAEIQRQATMGSFETAGSVRPGFISHRHDQAVMSVIFWKAKYQLLPYGTIAAKADVTGETYLQYGD
jgi:glycosyltransferase involved in cell wall biosynthesis